MLRNLAFIAAPLVTFGLAACASQPKSLATEGAAADTACTSGPVTGSLLPRHEAGFIASGDKLYLIGGRGMKPVSIFDPATNHWTTGATPPIELHHFQPVVVGEEIWIVGAMTGPWPDETPVDRIWRYLPSEDRFVAGPSLPSGRLRGAGGVAFYGGRIWWAGGITDGHRRGSVAWLDSYDLETGRWETHPDAKFPRDHWQLVAHANRLYAAGGRATAHDQGRDFDATVAQGEIFDIVTNAWLPIDPRFTLPTPRAGLMAHGAHGRIAFAGGESGAQTAAHSEIEVYDTKSGEWGTATPLARGRHGSGIAVHDVNRFLASGSGNRGGEPELDDMECIAGLQPVIPTSARLHHPLAFDFTGPQTSEESVLNPFTDYRLAVTFTSPDGKTHTIVRGFYATDGDAANSSAGSGNVWRAIFTPDRLGEWRWAARFSSGPDIAIDRDWSNGSEVPLAVANGRFTVYPSDAEGDDWRAPGNGRLIARGGRYVRSGSGEVWLKSGTNSPENLLAYEGFDGTFRLGGNSRDGEASSGEELHRFAAHYKDLTSTVSLWQTGKGRGLIGAIDYLASKGVNAAYFLTWNIDGDGKDVWPFADPTDPTRFDVSKLDQWERAFQHMQANGIALHLVLQETENELLMDGGDTGRIRRLYLAELVARFGHHNALVWNLGEENGPVHWRPEGQDDEQRKAMIDWLTAIDPYDHPILLHTHSEPADKDTIAGPLLGYPGLDGLSLQISDPSKVHSETRKWDRLSREAGNPWVLSMDEIGPWQDGAITDAEAIDGHASLAREALWGHLLAGGSGVEWYFGAHHPHNDLTAEDFRSRETLWEISAGARRLLEETFDLATTRPCSARSLSLPCLTGTARNGRNSVTMVFIPAGEPVPNSIERLPASPIWRNSTNPLLPASRNPGRDQVLLFEPSN
ncbi:DUF5060 domain-containing protein [Erythrobacter sp. THAF29]|uniref:DUF5060 domain-containing protein n=1 Tax=Erythrobacter sp. THAF29 TaxID=2587851 RepID=UPI0012AA3529|nr:DUF5060 domain-containing protein [Erythrobacter sp. THAF29]QFT78720.1 Kelch motif protein [Erythrobacter sp. THAF29]